MTLHKKEDKKENIKESWLELVKWWKVPTNSRFEAISQMKTRSKGQELSFRSTDFHLPENLIFPALLSNIQIIFLSAICLPQIISYQKINL